MEGDRAGGPAAADLSRDMAAARAACERRIAQGRERIAAAASAFRGDILSARSLASGSVAHRDKLDSLKDQLRVLQAALAEALSTQLKKESECELTRESISNATATNEQLRSLVVEQRARRDEFAKVIAHQREAIEALEANVDVVGKKNLDEAIMWYNKFLGFRVIAGEGVTFVFNKVDKQRPDDEYSFCIKVNNDEYSLIQCTPLIKDTEELVKDLNRTNDLSKFVKIMRARFQAAAIKGVHPATSLCSDTSSTTMSSPPVTSVDTTSEGTTNQSHSRSRFKNQDMCAERGAPPRSIASPLMSGSSTRRSPRLAAAATGSIH
ncbi:kinetochore protein SPC25 homolog [Hordeum vulgare subsp. vulgare]|uniref:Kinetochore protein SPC25 n=1 Tax=Hordeum vulgare subsp. vulgare TaxID=112509 RepID=A0A8I6WXI5_HORVV|nr:kinetochore protein SPC25 homolog [Hordeum vulgare subsp. vulgare]